MKLPSVILTLNLLIPFSLSLSSSLDNSMAKMTWEKVMKNTKMPPSLTHSTMKTDGVTIDGSWAHNLVEINAPPYGSSEKCKIDRRGGSHPPPGEKYLLRNNFTVGVMLSAHLRAPNEGLPTKFLTPTTAVNVPPFNSSKMKENLDFFKTSAQSLAAIIMQLSLDECEKINPINGRWQHCATSLDNLLSSVCTHLKCSRVKAVSALSSNKGKFRYVVEDVKTLAADKSSILCHQLGFPYAVYYCHQPAATTTYSVKLKRLVDGAKEEEEAFVVCHDETSKWNPRHIGLVTMGVKPGTPLCHYLQFHDTVFYEE